MSKPAGVELRRWFTYMVAVLLFVNVAAVSGGLLTYTSVRSVTEKYQPFAMATRKAETFTALAQRDMFEYLSELSDSTDPAIKKIEQLSESIAEAKATAPTEDQAAAIGEIELLVGQYKLAVEQLPKALQGSKDWSRVEEIKVTAIRIGGEVSKRTGDMASWAQDEIRARNQRLTYLTTGAMVTFMVVLLISIVVLLALKHWWTRFQDSILGI